VVVLGIDGAPPVRVAEYTFAVPALQPAAPGR
jgi:hypothetical protein